MIRFTLRGQMPSGKNAVQVTRLGQHYPKARFKAWRDLAGLQLRQQIRRDVGDWPINKPCSMRVQYFKSDLRRRDVPGMEDALCHLLERMGIVKDDALLENQNWHMAGLDRENPRVEVEIEVQA